MKIFLTISCIIFCLNAKTQVVSIDSTITKQSLQQTVYSLANDSMMGRFTGSIHAKAAADFIADRFQKAGLFPLAGNEKYFSSFRLILKGDTVSAINVIGGIAPKIKNDTVVIISAHYDHIGVKENNSSKEDSIFNGANDNASGIALIIELAKYYATLKTNRYTIIFAAFSGEELGLWGSQYMSSTINTTFINAVINVDMVGRPLSEHQKKCMVIAENPKAIIKKLNLPEKFFTADQFPEQHLFERSDHYSFRNAKNCFSLMATAPNDKYYHTVEDDVDTIDFDFLLSTTKKVALACEAFIK